MEKGIICIQSHFLYLQDIWGFFLKKEIDRDFPGSPVVTTLPFNAGGAGSIPGQGAKIPHASGPKTQNIKQKQYCNQFNKDFKNGPHQKIFKKKRDWQMETFFSGSDCD